MPNVNLIEEEGGEGTMQPMAAPPRRGGGGGGNSKVLLFVLVIIILGGGAFALNKFGIVKLWGKKPKPVMVTQIPEQPAPQQYAPVDTTTVPDTAAVSFVETPPLTEEKKPDMESALVMDKGGKSSRISSVKSSASSSPSTPSPKVGDMTGNYTIQVSAWRDQETAQKYAKRLEDAGYPAFVEQRQAKDGSWYTVRIGRYPSIKAARKAVESFAYELKANYWIDRVRSN